MSLDDSSFINSVISSSVSIIGNIVLAIFVMKYTNKELKPYKKILIIQIFFDIAYSIVGPFSKYGRIITDGIVYYIFAKTNFGILLPIKPAACFTTLATFFTNAVENILAIHFIYRYLLICQNKTMGIFSVFIVSFICLLPATVYSIVWFYNFFPNDNYEIYKEILKNSSTIYQKEAVPMFLASPLEMVSKYVYVSIIGSSIDYSIIGLCIFLLVWHFRKNQSIMSPKTLQIQKQFNKMLYIEAAMPFLTSFIPQISNLLGTWMKIPVFTFGSTFMIFLMPWTAALNPVVTIYVIVTYRKRFLQKVLCRKNIIGLDSTTTAEGVSRTIINVPIKISS